MKYFKNNTILTNDKNKFNAVIMGYNMEVNTIKVQTAT